MALIVWSGLCNTCWVPQSALHRSDSKHLQSALTHTWNTSVITLMLTEKCLRGHLNIAVYHEWMQYNDRTCKWSDYENDSWTVKSILMCYITISSIFYRIYGNVGFIFSGNVYVCQLCNIQCLVIVQLFLILCFHKLLEYFLLPPKMVTTETQKYII